MHIAGVDGYRFEDTFEMDGGTIRIRIIRESDSQAVGTARGNLAATLVQQARSIARADYESSLAVSQEDRAHEVFERRAVTTNDSGGEQVLQVAVA